mgnify:CR=1 FL=1
MAFDADGGDVGLVDGFLGVFDLVETTFGGEDGDVFVGGSGHFLLFFGSLVLGCVFTGKKNLLEFEKNRPEKVKELF